ncbi:MAG: Ig-like domain-containing protein, partial [Candidatus Hydrogenedentes bacterium]|nr:Ig-like domain-containing protein [Candidatus Hydrogenedentota bacterium]
STVVTLTFTSSEALASNPTVTVNTHAATYSTKTGQDYTYTYTIQADDSDGAATISIQGTDPAGNTGTTNSTTALTVDKTAPLFSSVAANPSLAKLSTVVTLTFMSSETLASNPTVTVNTHAATYSTNVGLNYTYTYTIQASDANGDATIAISGTDPAGNADSVTNTTALDVDKVAPTVTMATTAPEPTKTSPIPVTVTFSESVTGFDATDIVPTNGTVNDFAGSGASYSFNLVALGQGSVTADIAAGVAQDAAGNGNTIATQFSRTYDSSSPTVSSVTSSLANGSYRAGQAVPVQVTFSKAVTYAAGTGVAQLQLETGAVDRQAAYASGSGSTVLTFNYTVQSGDTTPDLEYLSTGALTLTGTATITDTAGNDATLTLPVLGSTNSLGGSKAIVIDTTPPSAALALDFLSPTTADVLAFSVDFNESVGSTFTQDRISLTGTLAAGASVTGITQSNNDYTVTVTIVDTNADGTLGITVGPGVTDLAGNVYPGDSSALYTVRNWFGFQDQPQGAKQYVGDKAVFTVVLNSHGDSVPAYQWWFDDVGKAAPTPISGENTPGLTVKPVTLESGGAYWCVVEYMGIPESSNTATLEVKDHLQITADPVGGTAPVDGSYTFTVVATDGYPPLSYLWKKDRAIIPDASETHYTRSKLTQFDSGTYTAEVNDANGDVRVSQNAVLIVPPGVPAIGVIGLAALFGLIITSSIRTRRKK